MSQAKDETESAKAPRQGIEERLSQMIKLQTVSAELEDRGMAAFDDFIALLEELYPLTHKHLKLEKITDLGLLFRWQGSDQKLSKEQGPAVLMAHFDVVPVDENDAWTHPPFEGRIADGWVYGRGTLDDKGPLIVIIEAVENLLAQGFTPKRDVYLSFGGNEETFGDAADKTARALESRGIVPWIVIDEGGAVVDSPLPFVEGDFAMIGLGEKGLATIRISAHSQGGHASTPPRLTAASRVARALTRLTPGTFSAKTPLAVTRMLQAFSASSSGAASTVLQALAGRPGLSAKVMAQLGGEMAAMVRTTIAPTMLAGGTASNVLPSSASAVLNLRIALGETVLDTVRRVRMQIRDKHVTVELVEGNDPSPESSADNEQFALISECVAVSHPGTKTVPYVLMAATDSRYYHRFSPATYRFAPLKMTSAQRATIHGVDERVEVSELKRGEIFHRTLLQAL